MYFICSSNIVKVMYFISFAQGLKLVLQIWAAVDLLVLADLIKPTEGLSGHLLNEFIVSQSFG